MTWNIKDGGGLMELSGLGMKPESFPFSIFMHGKGNVDWVTE